MDEEEQSNYVCLVCYTHIHAYHVQELPDYRRLWPVAFPELSQKITLSLGWYEDRHINNDHLEKMIIITATGPPL